MDTMTMNCRSSMFENSVQSIKLGVEDFSANNNQRVLSAIRNFYSGLLLLGKEVLITSSPNSDPDLLLASSYQPLPDGKGGMKINPSAATIDFDQLLKRLRQFGKPVSKEERGALEDLKEARNQIEHGHIPHGHEKLRELISSLFPLTINWFEILGEDPKHHLDHAYAVMLEMHKVFEAELRRCRNSYQNVDFYSDSLNGEALICPSCGSTLIEQLASENTNQSKMKLRCRSCGTTPEAEDVIVETLETVLGYEAYIRMTDTGEDGPIYLCSFCGKDTFVDFEETCAACGYTVEMKNCALCSSNIETELRLEGSDLCGYCRYKMEKD
ncbi:hypothetical protein ACFOY8_21130 [Thalassospira xianhensis]|uniref:Uncharacterized protein n=1 Tax=Thalassospira xianhensis MCCC 1A02616 TaxID=1177929 RepID=A0A367UFU2_9PROT|nr:hypothetical protein [Thalassospira xianhensis]RCK07176.1 hypothetical protein TH5_04365 [Thalassospira xianhensis MCCC 1A02616]